MWRLLLVYLSRMRRNQRRFSLLFLPSLCGNEIPNLRDLLLSAGKKRKRDVRIMLWLEQCGLVDERRSSATASSPYAVSVGYMLVIGLLCGPEYR
jgi:hypothetical protein